MGPPRSGRRRSERYGSESRRSDKQRFSQRRFSKGSGDDRALDAVAATVHQLAVLLAAGVPPASSWRYLAEEPSGSPDVARVVAREVGDGAPVSAALLAASGGLPPGQADAWRGLAAAWRVATESGAPLAPTLVDFAASLRALGEVQRDVRTALAGPVATSRVVVALPAVGIVLGALLGFDTLGALVSTPAGISCLIGGILLVAAGALWTRALLRRARPTSLTPGLGLDLMAIALTGGTSALRARQIVEAAIGDRDLRDDLSVLERVLSLSRRAGVPAAALLRAEAAECRARARSDGERAAASLGVTLMLPLGLCVLPAFMLLGVAPLVLSVIAITMDGFI